MVGILHFLISKRSNFKLHLQIYQLSQLIGKSLPDCGPEAVWYVFALWNGNCTAAQLEFLEGLSVLHNKIFLHRNYSVYG